MGVMNEEREKRVKGYMWVVGSVMRGGELF